MHSRKVTFNFLESCVKIVWSVIFGGFFFVFHRFKDCLMEERQSLLHQVSTLEKKVGEQKKSSHDGSPTQSLLRPLEEAERHGRWVDMNPLSC